MPAEQVYCYVVEDNVTVVTDIDGDVKNVVCPEFSRTTYRCGVKDTGIIRGTIKMVLDQYLDTRSYYCEFVTTVGNFAGLRNR